MPGTHLTSRETQRWLRLLRAAAVLLVTAIGFALAMDLATDIACTMAVCPRPSAPMGLWLWHALCTALALLLGAALLWLTGTRRRWCIAAFAIVLCLAFAGGFAAEGITSFSMLHLAALTLTGSFGLALLPRPPHRRGNRPAPPSTP